MKSNFVWLCAALLVLTGAQQIQAQVITNANVDRGLRFPGTPAYDGESYTQRFSYGLLLAPIYLNGDSRQLRYLDYLDRLDRAEKFGYRMPVDPYLETPAPPAVVPDAPRRGLFGFWRQR